MAPANRSHGDVAEVPPSAPLIDPLWIVRVDLHLMDVQHKTAEVWRVHVNRHLMRLFIRSFRGFRI